MVISCNDSSCYSNFENINKTTLKKLDEQQSSFFNLNIYPIFPLHIYQELTGFYSRRYTVVVLVCHQETG